MQQYDQKKIENEVSAFWKKKNIYKMVKENRKNKKPFFFIDGPPYASGSIHMGTALNKITKDCFVRYKRLQGYDVRYQPGYDTHGLPIANKVQKALNLKNKEEIEKFGIDKFNKECRKFATKYIKVMGEQFSKLGVWMDWDHPYLTLDKDYMENTWATFKMITDKGRLYKGVYPVHVCGKCATVVSYNEIEYSKVEENTILVKFKVKDKNEYLVIWTTTPWTLFGNTGIMVNPKFDYARVRVGDEVLIMAEKLVEDIIKVCKKEKYKILEVVKGKKLEGLEYENPLKDIVPLQEKIKPRVVLSSQFVTLDQGTGLVHTAPGHGMEDYTVGKKTGLDTVCPVKVDGTYDETAGKFKGVYVKDADPMIIEELEARDALLGSFPIKHDYPMCWRCKSPLLQMAIPQWFLKVEDIRKKLIEENKKIKWIPDWAQKRFHDWLENLGDWPISRQRYWGIPLPVWKCERCDELKVVGSIKELGKNLKDIHMPYVDEITFKCKCGGRMIREKEIFDVWFDSSVCSWASLGYPKEKKLFNEIWPPVINIEARDQIRGWWNSQLISSYMAFGKKPYDAIFMHGFVMNVDRVKMSKSAGAATPDDIIDRYGVDTLRYYLLTTPPGQDFFIDERTLGETTKAFNILWNTHNFIKTYCKKVAKPKNLMIEDKWIISKLNSLVKEVTEHNDEYYVNKSITAIEEFVLNDFSRWYIKLIRDRVSVGYKGKDRSAAEYCLLSVMDVLVKLLAPVVPFITEKMFLEMNKKGSVHLCDWPESDKKLINKKLEKQMEIVREVIEAIGAARADAKIKLRWPVKKVVVNSKDKEIKNSVKNLEDVIKKIGNMKIIEFDKKIKGMKKEFINGELILDTERDEELIEESMIRELFRKVQIMRKEAGLKVEQKINLHLKGEEKVLKRWKADIENGTTSKLSIGEVKGKHKDKLEFDGKKIEIGF